MKLLIIEDDLVLSKNLSTKFKNDFFVVDIANNGERGSSLARINKYDLIILDNQMPKKNGKQVLFEIRKDGNTTPILFLSIKFDANLKAELLNLGADDYLQKPFSYPELLARVKAILRRPKGYSPDIIKVGNLEINTDAHTVKCAKKKINLTKKEFLFLEYLAKNKDRVIGRGELVEYVWDINADMFSNTIEATVLRLRKKIKTACQKQLIQTVSGVGYKLCTEATVPQEAS